MPDAQIRSNMMNDGTTVFHCSFCEKPIRFRPDQQGQRGRCPSCKRSVVLVPNGRGDVEEFLSSTWFYQRTRILRGREEIGPIPDTEFLEMVQKEHITVGDPVKSPQMTKGQWVDFSRINLQSVSDRIEQRLAERKRREAVELRRVKVGQENRQKLKRGIRSALQGGGLSSRHRQAIEKFAIEAGIAESEIQETIAVESRGLVREVFEEALQDGILEPSEEQRLSQLAVSLGVELKFSHDDRTRIAMSQLAYALNCREFRPEEATEVPFKLKNNEQVLAECSAKWFEIADLKRPSGIPLGGDYYLKEFADGDVFLTNKQVSMVGELRSKKFPLASVSQVRRYADGIHFNRSSGKSVFLQGDMRDKEIACFALIAEHFCSGEPVLGFHPTTTFVPQDVESDTKPVANDYPRYTFRVVGDFVGNRESHARRLQEGDPVMLVRERNNVHDENAVAVYNLDRQQLGYLKREVAAWFAPIMDRGKDVRANVHCFNSHGSLIVGVFL
ncbi:HIRAN domain-containing protein [Crateriforma conspicua]|uniref:HIRAN domain protein n=1 Tax=Crateriforma conspicua TaxID=2527996 RepID=A0A5C6G1X4_9PLAN|nr:HIRAN domain-containing protein [Crateriforma conspicua]TWU67658.1 HIRAN domain protein [Crateriforma conspicua]